MTINNLSQLKRALASGHSFIILEHFLKPEHTGEIRTVQKMQTNGMYTGILNDPEHYVSRYNNGLGSWIDFGKASNWNFKNSECTLTIGQRKIWKIKVI